MSFALKLRGHDISWALGSQIVAIAEQQCEIASQGAQGAYGQGGQCDAGWLCVLGISGLVLGLISAAVSCWYVRHVRQHAMTHSLRDDIELRLAPPQGLDSSATPPDLPLATKGEGTGS